MARRLKLMRQPKYQRDGDPATSGPGFGLTTHDDALKIPLGWKEPRLIFVNSMSDLFHPEVPDEFIRRVFDVMSATPQHTYQMLTKRSQRLAHIAPSLPWPDNVWMGVSVESDRYAFRANHLRSVSNAAVRFLSVEPLVGPVPSLKLAGIDWVIVGGESGHGARPLDLVWVEAIQDQAERAGSKFFLKQLGSVWARSQSLRGKGDDPTTWPDRLRVREMPTASTSVLIGA
jgi:protein gp37